MLNINLSFVVFLLTTLAVYGQETAKLHKGRKSSVGPVVEVRDTSGVNPFDIADKVELLYYVGNRMQWWRDSKGQKYADVIEHGRLNVSTDRIAKRVTLDTAQVAEWSSALYAWNLCAEYMVAGCYEPRHLLLFYDARSRIIGAIEICVTCAGGWVSPGLRAVVFCPERTAMLASMIKK